MSAANIDALIARYLAAKAAEEEAERVRVALGAELAACFEVPSEGQSTHTTERYRVKLKGVVNRRADWAEIDRVYDRFRGAPRPERAKRELDVAGLRWIEENRPEYYAEIAKAITSTPGRVGIEVTPKEQK